MSPGRSSRSDVVAAATVASLAAAAVLAFASGAGEHPPAVTTPTAEPRVTHSPSPSPSLAGVIGAVVTRGPTTIRAEPSSRSPTIGVLRSGIILPVTEQRDGFLAVLTPCENHGWVRSSGVDVHLRAEGGARSLRDATILIDPGHGGDLVGATGPTGLPEKEPNLDIATRVAGRLDGARVFLTRTGDITAGLGYRDALANALGTHVLVSIHNNAEPDGPSVRPGTETYYQYGSAASKRLAGLLYEELVPALEGFEAAWVADTDAGAKYRLNASGTDYYALLRGTRTAAVIVEALFVSNRPEEDLLRRPDVRDAIAGAVARGLRRYFETGDPGSGFVEPYPREPGPAGRLPSMCNDPAP